MPVPIQIAISGAGGQLGYALAFRIAAGDLFGKDRPVALSLLEIPEHFHFVQALQMELEDCGYPLLSSCRIAHDPTTAFADADWVILLAGNALREGSESRLDLLRRNGPIFVEHGAAINVASPRARILVVAEPCNTNCLIAMSHALDVPKEHWFALNSVKALRGANLVASKTGARADQVKRLIVWGNHSETAYVDARHALVAGRAASELIDESDWLHNTLTDAVARRGNSVFKLRGGSPVGTATEAILDTIQAITTPTPLQSWFCVAVRSDGSYDLPKGLVYGFPVRTENGHTWSVVDQLYVDDNTQNRLRANVAELEHEAAIVTDLLALD